MRVKTIVCIGLSVVMIGFAGIGMAQEKTAEDSKLDELIKRVEELQRQFDEMKNNYETEIKALKEEVQQLKQPPSEEVEAEDQAAYLRQLAERIAGLEEMEEKAPEETVFKFGGLSLQKLNPEISVSGDFVGHYTNQSGTKRQTDAEMRGLELNFQSYLDPYSR